jgi:hypothetical protein
MQRLWMLVLGAALIAARADATVLVPADLGELSRDARVIVRGRVVAVDSRWTADRRSVETLVTLDVETYLKGSLGDTVTVRVPGGRLGRYRSIVVGAPEFAPDQRVILFLGHQGPSVPYILGLSQGVYRIALTASTWVVAPPALMATPAGQRIVRGDPARRPLALDAFEREVRALAGAAR